MRLISLTMHCGCRCDKNGDGKLTEEEVKEVIVLSASANRLGNLKKNAAAYASLIMEELDPDHKGYIEVHFFFLFLYLFDLTVE